MPRKRGRKKKSETLETEESTIESQDKKEETEELKAKLEVIKDKPDVIGYILRNSRSATIDAKDPTKIIDYALLSSSTIDIAEELSNIFNLGECNKVIVEGKNAKLLSISIGENSISIFMDKKADTEKIRKELL
ncbi:hypothetical protein J7K06_07855 [Candidatus Bathyarchaeota archaeon]|nr:hypothetical protein [Candidatus Bathyarchaeota archaeon]